MRYWPKLDDDEIVCEADAADFDEEAHKGLVYADQDILYLSHDDGLSVWS